VCLHDFEAAPEVIEWDRNDGARTGGLAHEAGAVEPHDIAVRHHQLSAPRQPTDWRGPVNWGKYPTCAVPKGRNKLPTNSITK